MKHIHMLIIGQRTDLRRVVRSRSLCAGRPLWRAPPRLGQRCQGFVCNAAPVPEIARKQRCSRTAAPQLPTPSIPFDPSLHACLHFTHHFFLVLFLSFFLFSECVFVIGDALCAICSTPSTRLSAPAPIISHSSHLSQGWA